MLELRDLFNDAFVDGHCHSNPLIAAYNDSVSNFYRSPSYRGVEDVKGVVASALVRVQRNPGALKATISTEQNLNERGGHNGTVIKVFISHSSKDEGLARSLINLIRMLFTFQRQISGARAFLDIAARRRSNSQSGAAGTSCRSCIHRIGHGSQPIVGVCTISRTTPREAKIGNSIDEFLFVWPPAGRGLGRRWRGSAIGPRSPRAMWSEGSFASIAQRLDRRRQNSVGAASRWHSLAGFVAPCPPGRIQSRARPGGPVLPIRPWYKRPPWSPWRRSFDIPC